MVAIAEAARELVRQRDAWLAGADEGRLTIDNSQSNEAPSPIVHRPSSPKDRTLTNLYNQRPDWLAEAYRRLDRAVFTAYGWPDDLTDDQILERLLALNLERAARQGAVGATQEADAE